MSRQETRQRVYSVLQAIPRRRLATYADVAERAGMGRGAAQAVGSILARTNLPLEIPWHRVVKTSGKLPNDGQSSERRRRLAAEGVHIDPNGRVDLNRYRWIGDIGEEGKVEMSEVSVKPGDIVTHKVGDGTSYVVLRIDDDGIAECEYYNFQNETFERISFFSVALEVHAAPPPQPPRSTNLDDDIPF